MTIRVLVIDDSATMRALLLSRLSGEAGIEVVGAAANAVEGRNLIKRLNPDVVTLDIEMPGMNGLDFLEKIMTLRPTPVIIVSGATTKGAEVTARALMLGAVACCSKADITVDRTGGDALPDLIHEAAQVRFSGARQARDGGAMASREVARGGTARPALIAIGASTGGIEALQTLLRGFPADCPPTAIVQHVNARFVPAIANSLNAICDAEVVVAEPDMPMHPGRVYIAPGDHRHMRIGGSATPCIKLRTGDPVAGHLPSVDVLLQSAAQTVGARAAGAVLTGMGCDGAQGLLAMARAGAKTIAQDEATSIVFGMPRAAISLGAARVVAPIERIADHLLAGGAA